MVPADNMQSDEGSDRPRKRPRKIWSCLECRRKKLQCDHGLPSCGRCVRSGAAASCTYATVPTASSIQPAQINVASHGGSNGSSNGHVVASSVTTDGLVSRIAVLEAKLRQAEHSTEVAASDHTQPVTNQADRHEFIFSPPTTAVNTNSPTLNDPHNVLVRGHAFRTKFNGSTCAASWSEHILGLSQFTKDAFAVSPAFDQVQQYLHKSETRTVLSGLRTSSDSDHIDLRSLLPSRTEADHLIQVYMDSFDLLYSIIHKPSFRDDYSKVWLNQDSAELRDLRPLVLVLLIIAIGNCMISTPLGVAGTHDRQVPRNKATHILDSCENWLAARIQQYASLIEFQIAFLMLLGRQLNARRSKRTWANAGGTIRVFICAGLHRDPEDMGKHVTVKDKIMRQRLWASIADLELQAALDHGMPPASWPQQSDVPPPPNVDDDDLEAVRPTVSFTKSSFLVIAEKSILLRHHLCSTLNDMRQLLPTQKATHITNTLRQYLLDVPQTWTGSGAKAASALLCLNLHQYILAIHEQQLRQPSITATEKQQSRMTLLESALQMIKIHKGLQDDENPIVEIFYGDHVRAALSICFVYTTADPMTDSFLITSVRETAMNSLEQILDIYCEKVVRFGGSKLHMWLISAANGLLKATGDPGKRACFIEAATENFTRPYYRLMALTRDEQQDSLPPDRLPPIRSVTTSNEILNAEATALQLDQDLNMLPFGEFAGWTFDDFTLDPAVYLG